MSDFKPQSAQQHFAQQRTSRAAEAVTAALDAQRKDSEGTRASNERFYNGLALYSGGTIALSVTFMGYLKTLSKPPGHPHWLAISSMNGRQQTRTKTNTKPMLKSMPPWFVMREACKPKPLYPKTT
jgi:hypothetical protein